VFLLAWLNQADIKPYVTGAAQPKLSQSNLRLIEIPLPPLPIQRRITGVISDYDDLIENNTRRIQILERMAQALYREWFVHFRFPGHAKVKRVASPLGPVPQGWAVRRLDEVANVNTATIRRGDEPENILYVDISSVGTGRIENIEPMAFANAPGRARRIVRHGDTIWSCVRPNRKSFSLILEPPADLIVSTGFAVLTPSKVPFSFLHQAVTTDEFVGYLTNHATGAAYPAVTAKEFEAAELLVPDEPLLRRFHEHCEPTLLLKENRLRKNITLRRTRDLLLPKLISGALDVPSVSANGAASHQPGATPQVSGRKSHQS
jgi:type I restriction enzyme S subunit